VRTTAIEAAAGLKVHEFLKRHGLEWRDVIGAD
jgi:hypothetical protein